MTTQPANAQIADVLERIAALLETQTEANPFRVGAYRDGAQTIRELAQPVAELVRRNQTDALKALPNIGEGLAAVIGEYVTSGRSNLLQDLEAKTAPGAAFTQVPGIGQELAERIAQHLDISTLEELEEAAHDGRLAAVEGFGPRRIEAVQTALAGMLSQSARRRQRQRTQDTNRPKQQEERPSVRLLLKIDEEYRKQAEAGKLRKIAPRRFNPQKEAWLPVMHTNQDSWSFTALYSNTAQAHELGKIHDWVVIYWKRDGKERQNTVVTETQGPLKGKRVVRGRALESQQFYEVKSS